MIVNFNDFTDHDYDICFANIDEQPRPKGNRGTRSKIKYKDMVCAFDIETTLLDEIEQSIMYIWQFQIDNMYTVIGRTWNEFLSFVEKITVRLDDDVKVVTYVHNLAYEFQFLAGVYNFAPEDVFLLDSRKPVKVTMGGLEFRCSYCQTNMSLDSFTHKMGVSDAKKHDFDYSKRRYYYTELTQDELEYCVNDVKGLVQAIKIEMYNDGDTLYTIPITSTGYVRRDFKKAMREVGRYRIWGISPTWEIYEMLREAFRGGNTHANRYNANFIINNVHSADRSSSYPEVQCNRQYPVRAFTVLAKDTSRDDINRFIYKRNMPVLMRVALSNVHLKRNEWGCPYISKSKCRNVINAGLDNGRILSADYLETTITDIDYKIISDEYDFDISIIKCAVSGYGNLPQPMIDVVCEYYRRKTELKNVDGQEYMYMKSKNKLNSVYGCTAQDPVKDTILFVDGAYEYEGNDPHELLQLHNRNAYIVYQWGVWCTAWARYELEEGIKLAHKTGAQFVYCDTDSVKYTGVIDWSDYNNSKVAASQKSGAYATDPQGVTHYMGVYEQEKSYSQFITMGAKKYAYTYDNGECHITIAGVPKKRGGEELQAAGGLSAMKEGFIFHAGKLQSVYNDDIDADYVTEESITIKITRNVALLPCEYRLGLTNDYRRLLENSYLYKKGLTLLKKSGTIGDSNISHTTQEKETKNEHY